MENNRKYTRARMAWGLLLLVGVASPVYAAGVSIAAVVNDAVISSADVDERRALIMATAGIPDTAENQQKLTPRVVQSLVDEALQLQEAKNQSLSVTDEELKKAVDGMAARGDTGETIRDFIRKRGLSMRSFEGQMRAQLAWGKVVGRKLRRNVTIAQDEVLRAQKAAATTGGEVELRMQALDISLAGDAEKGVKLAEEIALELKSGAEMASIAAHHLKQQSVRFNPPLWVSEKTLPPMLQQALRSLKNEEVTPPLRSPNSIQIIQLMDRKTTPKQDDATEYLIKQMAIAVPKKRDKSSLAALSAAAASLQANAGGCDEGSGLPKLNLPAEASFARVRLGAMSPAQRSVVSHLEVGEVSEPLMGAEALRLIMLCEKTEPSAGNLPDAETIRQQLFADKIELEAQKHLRNLRRDAFIDIKGAKE